MHTVRVSSYLLGRPVELLCLTVGYFFMSSSYLYCQYFAEGGPGWQTVIVVTSDITKYSGLKYFVGILIKQPPQSLPPPPPSGAGTLIFDRWVKMSSSTSSLAQTKCFKDFALRWRPVNVKFAISSDYIQYLCTFVHI